MGQIMWQKAALTLAGISFLGGCSGSVHHMPLVDEAQLGAAQTEVSRAGGPPARHSASDDEVRAEIGAAVARIRPAAQQICHQMAVGNCEWNIRISNDRSLNAGAGPNGVIIVNRGIVEYAQNEEQVAMVIAHEMGHQSSDHLGKSQRNAMVGALIGGVLVGALGAVASSRSSNSGAITAQAVSSGATMGASIGQISYSKEQEREADYLAALTLYRAGMDLDKARGFLVIMARASGRKETGMLDTHPAGPERLAAWDRAVAEIRASNGALPRRN
jgi:predicted Zn-dependent protease